MANDINGGLRNVLPGPLDSLRGPYDSLATANGAIPSVVVGGKNFREGKFVEIGTNGVYKTYWWRGTGQYLNSDLEEYVIDPDLSDYPTLDEVYTKSEVYSKTETLPASQLYNRTQVYTKAQVDQAVIGLSPDSSTLIPIFQSKIDYTEKDAIGGVPLISNVPLRLTTTGIKLLSGPLKSNTIITSDISGTWNLKVGDTTTPDNGGTILVDLDGRRWEREMIGIPFDIRLFGGVSGFNQTTWTGFNNDIPLQKASEAASKVAGGYVYIPNGVWGASQYKMLNAVPLRAEPLTKLCVIPSANPYFIAIDEGFIANTSIENLIIDGGYGKATGFNETQSCFGIVAKYKISDNTGGLWYSKFSNLEIRNFGIHGFYFEALDPDSNKDIANQFLTFENVKVYRKTHTATTGATCLKVLGQFGQIQYDALCQFDGEEDPQEGDINVDLRSSTTTTGSDEVYSVYFNGTTFQKAHKAVNTYYAKDVHVKGHFEECVVVLYSDTGSYGTLTHSYFGNCGKRALIPGFTGDGSLVYIGSTSVVSMDNNVLNGSCDYIAKAASGYNGFFYGTGNNITGGFSNLNYNTSVDASGVLDLKSHNGRIIIGSNANILKTIVTTKGVGQEVVIEPQGNLTIDATGNILLFRNSTTLTFRVGQLIRLRNLGNGFWSVVNQNDAYIIYGTASPDGSVLANKGALYLQTTGSTLIWVNNGGTTTWSDYLSRSQTDAKYALAGSNAITVSNAATLSLVVVDKRYYVFNGSTATWTLPVVTGNSGKPISIKNRGTGTLTVASASGSAIYTSTTNVSVNLAPGESISLVCDASYWLQM